MTKASFFFPFSFPLFSGLFSSHHRGKNAAHFHILSAICSFRSEASQVFMTHRKHIETDSVFFCECVSDFLQNDFPFSSVNSLLGHFFNIYLICLLFKMDITIINILPSHTFALCYRKNSPASYSLLTNTYYKLEAHQFPLNKTLNSPKFCFFFYIKSYKTHK